MRFRKLRELRVINELTQKDLAKILNCTQQSLSAYEKGLRDVPVDVLIKYAEYFDVTIDYLVGRDTKPKNK